MKKQLIISKKGKFLLTFLFLICPILPLTFSLNSSFTSAQSLLAQQTQADIQQEAGFSFYQDGNFQAALTAYEEALQLYQNQGNLSSEGITFYLIGAVYEKMNNYNQALISYEDALAIFQQINDQENKSETLYSIGNIHKIFGEYDQAIALYEEALTIYQENEDIVGEAQALREMALTHHLAENYETARSFYEEALVIYREVNDLNNESIIVRNLADIDSNLGNLQRAEDSYQESLNNLLILAIEVSENVNPQNIDNHPSIDYYFQALEMAKSTNDSHQESIIHQNLGQLYLQGRRINLALNHYENALEISQKNENIEEEGYILAEIASIHTRLYDFTQAENNLANARRIFQGRNNQYGEGIILKKLGSLSLARRDYNTALNYYQQALNIIQSGNHPIEKAEIFHQLGEVSRRQENYQQARNYYQQALSIYQSNNNPLQESQTLNGLGSVEYHLGNSQEAFNSYEEGLKIAQRIGSLETQASLLNNMGIIASQLGQKELAIGNLQQAVTLYKELGFRALAAQTFSDIAFIYHQENNDELAIIFYKRAINLVEEIRQDLSILPQEDQSVFSRSFTQTYRSLADILLQKERIQEAYQVLDLLKVQEIDEYLQNAPANEVTAEGVMILPSESEIIDEYATVESEAIAQGKELTILQSIPNSQLTPAQKERIEFLTQQQQEITQNFVKLIRDPDVVAFSQQLSQTAKEQSINLSQLRGISDNLQQLNDKTALLYPLILEDRIEIILATPYTAPIRKTVYIAKTDVNQAVSKFIQVLSDPRRDAIRMGQEFYELLIKPIENELQEGEIETILYAPDGQLRYLPLAAFHDGDRWLIEKYKINNITSASLTDLNSRPNSRFNILAGAFTQGDYTFEAGTRSFSFSGLPFAGVEVQNLADTIPNTTQLLDEEFTKNTVLNQLNRHSIIHFATHAAFLPGDPTESFIILGNGEKLSLDEIQQTWFLTNVDLIVLSACQTGVGGQLGNGDEILGFGYLMQDVGARASMASLWYVSDGGTQALMNAFYSQLQNTNITKAEALRQAQIAMIKDDESQLGESKNMTHPFYWSAFILIGNGL